MDMFTRHYTPPNTAMWAYSALRQNPYMTPQQAIAAYHQHTQMREWAARAAMMNQAKTAETKPRLAKDEVEQLETEFQKNPKPNSSLKKGLAEQMRVDVARINNWFQNRRAKAKQEKRTAEFEAKQKLEDERADPRVSEFFEDNNHIDDLRPSSAPLPVQQSPLNIMTALSAKSPATPESQEYPASPSIKQEPTNEIPHSPSHFASPESIFVTPESEQPDLNYIFQSQADIMNLPTLIKPVSESGIRSVGATPFGGYVIPPSFQLYNGVALADQDSPPPSSNCLGDIYSHPSPESMVQSPQINLRSQPSTIASRRNAPRPAPLGLNALRAHVQPGPKTVDGSRPHDHQSNSMKRVSSASSSVRIQKSVSASPLNRYVERKPERFLHLARSPSRIANAAAAPPTPDTPQQVIREGTAASTSSDENAYNYHTSSFHPIPLTADPTLKTPPTTPGMVSNITDALFGSDVQYNSYEDSIRSTFGSADFMPSAHSVHSLQNYLASSQPPTPSFPQFQPEYSMASPGNVVPHYQLYPGHNNDYTWPESASITSAQSSPGLTIQGTFQTQFTFNNSTLNDYCEPKC